MGRIPKTLAGISLSLFLLLVLPILAPGPSHADARAILYGVTGWGSDLGIIDPSDGSIIDVLFITVDDAEIRASYGLAHHPASGQLYAIVRLEGDRLAPRWLATIDPATAAATLIGDLGDLFSGLAFSSDGTLYGMTGTGAGDGSSLYTIDPSNAAVTRVNRYPNGNGGHAIAFNPHDGLLYHASGSFGEYNNPGQGQILEKIDLSDRSSTIVPLPAKPRRLSSLSYASDIDAFHGLDRNRDLLDLGANGVANIGVPLSSVDRITWSEASSKLYGIVCCVQHPDSGASMASLLTVDPGNGSVETVGDIPDVEFVSGGFAAHPATGALYALLFISSLGEDRLVRIDPNTANATVLGSSPTYVESLSFDPDGLLYGSSYDQLFTVSTVDGSLSQVGLLPAPASAIAFDLRDGTLYLAALNDWWSFDVTQQSGTPVAHDVFGFESVLGMTYAKERGHFFASDRNGAFYRLEANGSYQSLGNPGWTWKGLVYVPEPAGGAAAAFSLVTLAFIKRRGRIER